MAVLLCRCLAGPTHRRDVSSSIEDGHLREGNGVLAVELLFQLLKGCFGIYLMTCLSSKI